MREAESGVCAVCGSAVELQVDSSLLDELRQGINDLESEEERADQLAASRLATWHAAEEDLAAARGRAQHMNAMREAFQRRRTAELEVSRLEGMLAERQQAVAGAEVPSLDDSSVRILAAAETEAHERMRSAQGALFDALNEQIVLLGRAFGIDALESVRIDGAAHLRVWKGGESTSFSHLTRGERLRLKVAVIIAMLRLGEQQHIGRHPGLIVIDSPGAEESGASDFTRLLRELEAVSVELPHLQVITASARAEQVLSVLAPDRVRVAPKGETVW